MVDPGADWETFKKTNAPIKQMYTDKCHYKGPLITRTITIVTIIIDSLCGDISPHVQGVKIANLAESFNCLFTICL